MEFRSGNSIEIKIIGPGIFSRGDNYGIRLTLSDELSFGISLIAITRKPENVNARFIIPFHCSTFQYRAQNSKLPCIKQVLELYRVAPLTNF